MITRAQMAAFRAYWSVGNARPGCAPSSPGFAAAAEVYAVAGELVLRSFGWEKELHGDLWEKWEGCALYTFTKRDALRAIQADFLDAATGFEVEPETLETK